MTSPSTAEVLLELEGANGSSKTVMHLIVIGFHCRSGYRVEFCTPPLETGHDTNAQTNQHDSQGGEIMLPEEWECIRYLALPDGAHNHDRGRFDFI